MISVIATALGVIAMIGLWSLAWTIWRPQWGTAQAAHELARRDAWDEDTAPDRTTPLPPPSWLFEQALDADAVPGLGPRSDSVANTLCFRRSSLEFLSSRQQDKTDVLPDQVLAEPEEPARIDDLSGPDSTSQ